MTRQMQVQKSRQPASSRDRIDAQDREAAEFEQAMQTAVEALQRLRAVVAEADRFLEDEEFGHA